MSPRILVAEDNQINQRVARDLLQNAGFEVDVVENGQQVLDALARGTYDLILLDCQMPVMDGFEAARALRLSADADALKIVAMTANVMSGDRERCLAAGMDDHLAKPFTPRELLERVRYWLERPRGAPAVHSPHVPVPGLELVNDAALEELIALGEEDAEELLEDLQSLLQVALEKARGDLEIALATRAWESLGRSAHTLKSSTATLGLFPLSETCRGLEQAANSGQQLESEEYLARFQRLVAPSMEELDATIRKLLAR